MGDSATLSEAIQNGDRDRAKELTLEAINAGTAPGAILDSMTGAMDVVGRLFKDGELFVPEVLIAARAMKESMALLEPLLVEAGLEPNLTALVGTVTGDLHDIGKNLVGMMWRGANFEVVDLGTNVTPAQFVEAAREHGARVVGLSALLTTTMVCMKDVIDAIRADGLDDVKVIVGGAPITEAFSKEIGADGFAPDAASAVEVARQLTA